MRIGLLITSIGNFGQKGFYNAQEIGLAKELDKLADEVIIYKLIPADQEKQVESVDGCQHTILNLIPAKNAGINGIMDPEMMDKTLDALLYFSDTQVMVPKVARWARKNRIALYPYIGVLESHSTSRVKKVLINLLFRRNLKEYRRLHCFVKTPDVQNKLCRMGVENISVMPVGLDQTLLRKNFAEESVGELKKKYDFQEEEKVILFIGRFVAEKQPERMVEIFRTLYEQDQAYRLLMVGTGELRKVTEEKVRQLDLSSKVTFIDKIPNSEIWELYRLAEAFVNLNQQEIFGMAILEAMYYECKVVAWKAPGPELIIEHGKSGYLVESQSEAVACICAPEKIGEMAHSRILSRFTWEWTARHIYDAISCLC